MSNQKEVIGELYFSDHEPRIIGHLQIDGVYYEIVGMRKAKIPVDLTGHVKRADNDERSATGERECDIS